MNAGQRGGRAQTHARRSMGRWLLVSVLGCATLAACGGSDGSAGADGGNSARTTVPTTATTPARSASERARAALLRAGDVPGGMTVTEPPFADNRCIPKRLFRPTALAVVEAPTRQSNGTHVLNTAAIFRDHAAASRAYARYVSRENRRCTVRASRAAALRTAGSEILSHVEVFRAGPPVTVVRYAVKVLRFGTAVFADEAVVLDGRAVSTVSLVRQGEPVTDTVRAEVISALTDRLSASLR